MRSSTITGIVMLLLTLGVSGFAGYGVYSFQKDLRAIEEASAEDINWTSNQLELELSKLTTTLLHFQVPDSSVNARDVNTRFDILWSRIALFQEGDVGKRLLAYDEDLNIVSDLFSFMQAVDQRVVGLQDGDVATASMLYDQFFIHQKKLTEFSRAVTVGEENVNRNLREEMMFRTMRTLILSGLATFAALLTLGFIYRQSRKFEALAVSNEKLAIDAEKASRTKSKFLTMMSHELRTPMNGVMGLLSLAQQHAVQANQKRLLDQAETSAKSMLGLLSDIFDFSELQADDVKLEVKTFRVTQLKSAIEDRFSALAKREGLSFNVNIAEDVPSLIQGDFRRVRQAIIHLAQYIVETAGTRDIEIDLSFNDDRLNTDISFAYSKSGGAWSPDLILGDSERGDDKFATEALGPMISRGMIDVMGGDIKLSSDADNRISVITSIPCEVATCNKAIVKIYASTTAMEAICKAALSNEDVVFVDGDSRAEVTQVVIESGGMDEPQFIDHAKQNYPNAVMIAIGGPLDPEVFDYKIKLPIDFSEFRKIVSTNT